VDVLVSGVAAREASLKLLAPYLGCDTDTQSQIVSSLLLHHRLDISAVEAHLWGMLQAREAAAYVACSREPLEADEKQLIYEEARRPVKALEAEVAAARAQLKTLHVDELSQEWCERRTLVAELESALRAARVNAAQDIFAQMNADGLGMGEDRVAGEVTLDLHGLHAREAERVMTELLDCVLPATRSLVVITGRGAHSANGISVLRPVIDRLAAGRAANVCLEPVAGNPGAMRLRALG
jgi:DNA-nicking Smr family endonuclease